MTNTSEYLPYNSVVQNLLVTKEYPEYPFFNGTGFFVIFPPYDYIFYVTAKHCLIEPKSNKLKGDLLLSYTSGNTNANDKAIKINGYLYPLYKDTNEEEDVIIAIIDENIDKDKIEILRNRALKLQHQEDIDNLLNLHCEFNENIRVVGFPKTSQEIDYDNNNAISQPRGFYGKIKNNAKSRFYYGFEEVNWKGKDYNGFSGSPVLALLKEYNSKSVSAIVIGVLLTFTEQRGEFVSINCVTDTIGEYIKMKMNK